MIKSYLRFEVLFIFNEYNFFIFIMLSFGHLYYSSLIELSGPLSFFLFF